MAVGRSSKTGKGPGGKGGRVTDGIAGSCSGAASSAASLPKASSRSITRTSTPEGFHQRERQDHPGAHHRHQGAYQRQLSVAVKRARFLALLPYTDLH
jgi:hypothetical protein